MTTLQDIANAIYAQEGTVQNNNPGNLVYVGQAGATGADSRGFAIFPTLATGNAAEVAQLQLNVTRGTCATGAAVNTLSDLISCLSPPSENNTAAYTAAVAAATGLSPDSVLSTALSTQSTGLFSTAGSDAAVTPDDSASAIDWTDPTVIAVAIGTALTFWLAFRE